MAIQWKDNRLHKEWAELPVHNRRLRKVLDALSTFAELELGKDLVITCLYRDPAENAAVGGIANSPHMSWEAVDLRSSTFTQEEIDRMLAFLNCFSFRNGKKTAICHAVAGGAKHFHIQVAKAGKGA